MIMDSHSTRHIHTQKRLHGGKRVALVWVCMMSCSTCWVGMKLLDSFACVSSPPLEMISDGNDRYEVVSPHARSRN